MNDQSGYSVQITGDNPALSDLGLSWSTAVFSADDGIGPMSSLHEAGDALVAVAQFDDDGMTALGSGVMVAPGLLLTATHVIDECRHDGHTPVFCTFLPGAMRAWLPIDVVTVSGTSNFHADRTVVSDLSLVSCTLNSLAHADRPLMLAPMQIALPLIGERLWAMGFRHERISDDGTFVTPLVSSGLVTAVFPDGRGERMPSPCCEVEMKTYGGMSGGAVFNADGYLVGIVSSSFDEGPSYLTLIWDALRLNVKGPIPKLAADERVSLFGAKARNLAKIKGDVRRDPFGDVAFKMSVAEAELLAASVPAHKIERGPARALDDEQLEAFVNEWGSDMEDIVAEAAIDRFRAWSIPKVREFLALSGIPNGCLNAITQFAVEDLEGVEEFEITFTECQEGGRLRIDFYFELRLFVWTIEVPTDEYRANAGLFAKNFYNIVPDRSSTSMDIAQRCFFKAYMTFNPDSQTFSDVSVVSSAVRLPWRSKAR